jgi:hypothetical protein
MILETRLRSAKPDHCIQEDLISAHAYCASYRPEDTQPISIDPDEKLQDVDSYTN